MALTPFQWHAVWVHFTVATSLLFLLGAVAKLAAAKLDAPPLRWTLRVLLVLGMVASLLAALPAKSLATAAWNPSFFVVNRQTMESYLAFLGYLPYALAGLLALEVVASTVIRDLLGRFLTVFGAAVVSLLVLYGADQHLDLVFNLGFGVKANWLDFDAPKDPEALKALSLEKHVPYATTPQAHAPAKAEPPHWTYEGHHGPAHWGDLAPEFALCKTGKKQTPINLGKKIAWAETGEELKRHWKPAPLVLLNNGHTIQQQFAGGQTSEAQHRSWPLAQFHFHTPSEHKVSSHPYPMELHFVHKTEGGELLVMGVFFRQGKANPEIEKILRHLPREVGKDTPAPGVTLDPNGLFPDGTIHYHYSGSLTTPPCSEGVNWYVMDTPVEASADQLKRMRAVMGANSRPVQSLGKRQLKLMVPGKANQF